MQPRGQAHGPAPAQPAPAGRGQPGPHLAVLVGFHAEERVGELGIDVHEARPEPGHHHGIGEHAGHHVPAVPDDLDDPRIGKRIGERLRAIDKVRARIPKRFQPAQVDARPDGVGGKPARDPAVTRALQAAMRADLPSLRERVPDDGGGRLRPALVDGRPPGERVDGTQHRGLPYRHVKARGGFQGAADKGRSRLRCADYEDRLVDAAGVDDENVTRWGHALLTVWIF